MWARAPSYYWDMDAEHRVIIVASLDYPADRVEQLAGLSHVWAPLTPAIQAVSRRIWSRRPDRDLGSRIGGLTLFRAGPNPEANLLGILGEVELHHGEASHGHQVSRIEVFGVASTDQIRAAFGDLGFSRVEASGDGLVAYRGES